jgi:acetyltransferase-like isoleucine patch superfamily enzyme
MQLRQRIPHFITDYVHLCILRARYPRCEIRTSRIGDNVVLGAHCTIHRDAEINSNVTVGAHTYVNTGTVIGSGTIGTFCSIGYGCQIGMPQHPTAFVSASPAAYGRNNLFGAPPLWNEYARPPVIQNDVWVGSLVTVLQGVTIGNGAVIGAGSVVTKDVPDYAVACGVPARVRRMRFDPATIQNLLAWRWWNRPLGELVAFAPYFTGMWPVEKLACTPAGKVAS